MREIKFRAWDKEENKMIYDIQDEFEERTSLGMDSFGHYLNDDDFEIMQYTGLKDCEENRIYEGDVVEITWADNKTKRKYKVFYFKEGAFFQLENLENEDELETLCGWSQSQLKVLGNIYENTELLSEN